MKRYAPILSSGTYRFFEFGLKLTYIPSVDTSGDSEYHIFERNISAGRYSSAPAASRCRERITLIDSFHSNEPDFAVLPPIHMGYKNTAAHIRYTHCFVPSKLGERGKVYMIVYRELSSLEKDLGFSSKTLYTLSNRIHRHYRTVKLPKENGESRILHVPDDLLKAVQIKIAQNLLLFEEISPYATAYYPGSCTLRNAAPHVGKQTVMKLDIRQFFDRCLYPLVKNKAFPAARYSEANRILLTLLCTYEDALPQGAPTSPAISNIILKDFDNAVGSWCNKHNIAYTRYCDDMTFSGTFDPAAVKSYVRAELRKLGFFLNDSKTTVLHNGQKKSVTGIVVNEKLSIPASYRRKLRQELYYCKKFGIESHLQKIGNKISEDKFVLQLLGRVNYVLSVDRNDREMQFYRRWLIDLINPQQNKWQFPT